MADRLHGHPCSTCSQSGATLAAVLILVTAGTLLAISALRSATTEAQLSGTLIAAQEAFWLAELGVASGINFALTRPAALPDAGFIDIATYTSPAGGHAETAVHHSGSDNHCPPLLPANVIRDHYEIHATGYAGRAAVSTHVQGFYVCTALCATLLCDIPEYPPVKSYWKALTGGLPP